MVKKCCVIKLLRELGIRSNFKSFDERLLAQKIIYLAQSLFNIDFGYKFVWHIRGPYSKALSKDLRAYSSKTLCECNDLSRDSITKIITLINELRSASKGLSHSVEVLASYVMLTRDVYPRSQDPYKDLTSKKPYITYEDVNEVLSIARKYVVI